jgi:predicted Zn-dependent peptidase
MFGAYVGIHPDNVRETIRLIVNEMRTLKTQQVEDTELTDAKNYTKGNLMLAAESVDNQMVRLAQNEINFGRHLPLQEIIDGVNATTVDDICTLSREIFREDRLALTTLGPISDKENVEHLLLI